MLVKTKELGIILIFFLLSLMPITFSYSSYETNKVYSTYLDETGTLSGYVTDASMKPIEGARIEVYFHGTYEEDYSDSSGYYHVTNVPICYCLKNATASKEGYRSKCVLLSINETTIQNFVLIPLGNTLDVGGSGPGNYSKIQDAIDDANEGDTVFVYNGIYYENIFINTTINLIGQDKNSTIIDGDKKHDVIYIGFPANNVNITGFTIQNSGNYSAGGALFDAGIEIHSDYNNIKNNIISNHPLYGIFFWASKRNNIFYNRITKCERSGIDFLAGPNNIFSYNVIYNNEVGISFLGSSNSKDNILSYNTFFGNQKGLAMYDSRNKIFYNNFINNVDFNAMSHFNFWNMKPSRNIWESNYWDDWIGLGPKWVPGFLGFNFDLNPAEEPYPYPEVLK